MTETRTTRRSVFSTKGHLPLLFLLALTAAMPAAGCKSGARRPDSPAVAAAREEIRRTWGKELEDLPVLHLDVVSPNNEYIEKEFADAFSLHHAVRYGQRVDVEYRNVGGTNQILDYLRNVYRRSDRSGIDVVWGGGDPAFEALAREGLLTPLALAPEVLANVPGTFGGVRMYDPNRLWCGTAISGFGFLYRRDLLEQLRIDPPRLWDDLGSPRFFDLIALADPTQSGSAAEANEMIVQSAPDWPAGWAKLLDILSNAKQFYEGASGAADAPALGEAPVATAIDFYGTLRVEKDPERLVFVSPRGQTAFNPDPIGILKNPPHPELAQRFVDFVLSVPGQALWALPPGGRDGPAEHALRRQPIRRDVYALYAGKFVPGLVNPYESGGEMTLDIPMRQVRSGVLKQLVRCAAIDNLPDLRRARKRLIELNFPPDRVRDFHELPPNLRKLSDVAAAAQALQVPTAAEKMRSEWQRFFRETYQRVAQ